MAGKKMKEKYKKYGVKKKLGLDPENMDLCDWVTLSHKAQRRWRNSACQFV